MYSTADRNDHLNEMENKQKLQTDFMPAIQNKPIVF